jgi:CRISPR-associated protein Cas1
MRRIIDLSGSASSHDAGLVRVRIDKGCLLIAHGIDEDAEEIRVPTHEVAVLVLGHRLALSGAVLGAVSANGGAVLSLDDRFRPAGLMLPVAGNFAHAARLRQQIDKLPACAHRLWQQLVRSKIVAQARLLRAADDYAIADRLDTMADAVAPGDPANVEATAARLYWPALFGAHFRRDDTSPENVMLNYGYAVLRSVVARAVCAAGLHPALGLHHHGAYDSFALADDLMEPARPIIDQLVMTLPVPRELDRAGKRAILGSMLADVDIGGHSARLIEAYEQTCTSLRDVLAGERPLLDLPALL